MSFSTLQPQDDIDKNISQSVEGEVGIGGHSNVSLIQDESSQHDTQLSCSEEENIVSVLNYFVTYN